VLLFHFNASPLQEQVDQLGMVNDLEIGAKLPVVILERAETVRAIGDNFFDPVFVKELDILTGQLIKNIFVSQPALRITAALFFVSQNPP